MSGTSELSAPAPAGADAGVPGLDEAVLRSFEGREAVPPSVAPDPVGLAMIRHFVDAVGDRCPVHLDGAAAAATGRAGVVAPAAMLQVWTMPTLRRKLDMDAGAARGERMPGAQGELFGLLAERGFTAIVATDSDQEYRRELVLGDVLASSSVIESVSPEKRTALGAGHFVTVRTTYRDAAGEVVATMLFRMLLYRPAQRPPAPAPAGGRPHPLVTPDTAFFFEALREGSIRVQRCTACGELRHPPRPRCAACGCYEWEAVAAGGSGTLHSYVVVHHPQMPGFEYPLPVGLVELAEGVRIVAELAGVELEEIEIGMPLVAEIVRIDDELSVPRFRPPAPAPAAADAAGAAEPNRVELPGSEPCRPTQFEAPAVREPNRVELPGSEPGNSTQFEPPAPAPAPAPGAPLPTIVVPLTRTAIVAGALATRDFQDVHHDQELARTHGAPDIFMNILTTNGYVGRLATEWAGPAAVIERITIRLGAPNYAGDTMHLTGEVAEVEEVPGGTRVALAVRGSNRLGNHVTGRVELRLPAPAAPAEPA